MTTRLDQMPEWVALRHHARGVKHRRLQALFTRDRRRFEHFSRQAAGILLDFSRQNVDRRTMELLLNLARASDLEGWRDRQFQGERINLSEDRAVLHTALRGEQRNRAPAEVRGEVRSLHEQLESLAVRIRSGQWKGHTGRTIRSVVNIGIGGSDLGPAMVCRALKSDPEAPDIRFLSNVDPAQFTRTTTDLDPETTLFIVASKTFTTLETLSNAQLARQWLTGTEADAAAMSRHFIAVTGSPRRAAEFGIPEANTLPMPDWIGGRFSLWSAIGLSIALHIGVEGFRGLLEGAAKMDTHFLSAPLADNLPVLFGLLGIWNRNFRGAASLAVVPYIEALERLPDFLQQLEMESNGKRVTRDGSAVSWETCPVIWGATGTNGQHAFFQQLHQGTDEIPVDFIVVRQGPPAREVMHRKLVANAVAQSAALALGRDVEEVRQRLAAAGMDHDETLESAPHRTYPGNRPSNMLVLDALEPETLGALIALYEHKVSVQGIVWQICSYDQWGVELGKELASEMDGRLSMQDGAEDSGDVVGGLVEWLRR